MRWSVFVADIFNSISKSLNKFKKSRHRQLSYCFERNALLNRLLSSSKQLIIKNSFEKQIKKNNNNNVMKYEKERWLKNVMLIIDRSSIERENVCCRMNLTFTLIILIISVTNLMITSKVFIHISITLVILIISLKTVLTFIYALVSI